MGIHSKLAPEVQEVDVIIAGGGTAACVIAGRLAAADPNLSILVIEYGKDNHNNPLIRTPALYPMHLQPDSESTIFYKSTKSKHMGDRESIVPAGGVLGGGSSINFLMYTRAQRSDFDSWNTPGWSADEMMPFLNKLESYHGPGDAANHGFKGPISVTDGNYRNKKSEDDWMSAASKKGYRETRDCQALDSELGFQRWLRYVTPEGQRCDAAHAYLHPVLQDGQHPNLHVLTESIASRILFENDSQGGSPRACAVECEPNPRFQQFAAVGLNPRPKQIIRARKLVVSACGAIGSPLLLERSGLGDPSILQKAGVSKIIHDLPGVGREYEDHQLSLFPYKTNLSSSDTIDDLLSQRKGPESLAELGQLGWNAIDISSKIRPHEEDVDGLGPEFRKAWDRDFKGQGKEDRPLMLMATVNGYLGDHTGLDPDTRYTMVGSYTAYPYSRGHVHITGPDAFDGPGGQGIDFDVGFFSDKEDLDVKAQVWAYKLGREIMRRTDMFKGEMKEFHPNFPEGSKAAVGEWEEGKKVTEDIVYTAEDDEAIVEHLRKVIATTWHGLGTARMAPEEEGGVVDKDLNVHGVRGLKVADLSIVPQNVGANTNNTALVIGEKAADIIARELGISV